MAFSDQFLEELRARTGLADVISRHVKLVKKGREADAVIVRSERGAIVVSVTVMEDAVKKVLKRFNLAKNFKIKTLIRSKNVSILLRLTLWSGGRVPELLSEIQREVYQRVKRLLGDENKLQVACDVVKIENHEPNLHEPKLDDAVNV